MHVTSSYDVEPVTSSQPRPDSGCLFTVLPFTVLRREIAWSEGERARSERGRERESERERERERVTVPSL
jgi:hypothetical protein